VVSIAGFEDESTRLANLVIPAETHAEKEGTVTHPEGRLQRLRRNVPLPEGMIPGWRFLAAVATELGAAIAPDAPADVFDALSKQVSFYDSLTYEEIGGKGLRWCDRDPGRSWTPAGAPPAGPAAGTPGEPPPSEARTADSSLGGHSPPADGPGGGALVLGTYRDLWATDVTKRNPALRFLMPKQKLEVHVKDAEALGVSNGDEVVVSVNGHSVEATVAIRERMREGAAFLIEGTDEGNGNLLTNGVPRPVEVSKR
jgi:NADH-quinone oxidoreductase subunit G